MAHFFGKVLSSSNVIDKIVFQINSCRFVCVCHLKVNIVKRKNIKKLEDFTFVKRLNLCLFTLITSLSTWWMRFYLF